MKMSAQIYQKIFNMSSDKICFIGIGNVLRNDDAIGTIIAEELIKNKNVEKNAIVINVEDVLENYVYKIAENSAKNIVLIDAVRDINDAGAIGNIFFQELASIATKDINNFSTHKLALSISEKIFSEHGKKTWLLGIIVNNTEFGTTITPAVSTAGVEICTKIINIYNQLAQAK